MFYVEPLLLLALVAWVARGAPRPARWTAVAVAVPVALLPAIPFERVFNVSLLSDTFALIPLMRVSALLDGGVDAVRALFAVGAVAAALLFVLVPRRFAALTIGAVAALPLRCRPGPSPARCATRRTPRARRPTPRTLTGSTSASGPTPRCRSSLPPTLSRTRTFCGRRSSGTARSVTSTASNVARPDMGSGRTDDHRRPRPVRPGRRTGGHCRRATSSHSRASTSQGSRSPPRVASCCTAFDGPLRLESQLDGVSADGWSGTNATYTNYAETRRHSPGGRRACGLERTGHARAE